MSNLKAVTLCGGFNKYGFPYGKRTPDTHPYNYDEHTLYLVKDVDSDGSAYTDRLFQWDSTKYNELCKKHFGNVGQYWDNRDFKLIEKWLQDYNDLPKLQLVEVKEYCNQSSGYPVWLFTWVANK